MQGTYLEEDLQLIQKYFPGARSVNLRTPFDLTTEPTGHRRTWNLAIDDTDNPRLGGILWTH
jgi:hypothetical protein